MTALSSCVTRTTRAARALLRAGAALALAATGAAQAAPLALDAARSEIAFVSRQMGVPVEGKFRRFSAQLDFDARKPESSRASLEVDVASIDAGSDEANGEVVRKAWFNAAQFPKATFASSAIRPLGGGRFELTGAMSIKGRTRNVTTPLSVRSAGAAQVFEGSFVLNRNDFGIGDGPWNDPETVAYEVQVKFRLVANPK